jgi:hypothetical protein
MSHCLEKAEILKRKEKESGFIKGRIREASKD